MTEAKDAIRGKQNHRDENESGYPKGQADGAVDVGSCCDTVCSVSSCMLFSFDVVDVAFREIVYE